MVPVVNVRQLADVNSAVIGNLQAGDSVTILSCDGEWCEITSPFNGFVFRGCLSDNPDGLDEEEKVEEAEEEKEEMKEELTEAYKVIKFLRSKINEVNLLNAKLLYSNKLFRTYSLNESQKLKVIENFDRAHSLREVKLLYTALAENFTGSKTKKVVKESFASKPVASTKPSNTTVLNEGNELANRFKKLAGLIK